MPGFALQPTDLRLDRRDPAIAVISIDRPHRRNAMTLAMWSRLADMTIELGQAREVRAILLTGGGGHFCAGADIKEFSAVRSSAAQGEAYEHEVARCQEAITVSPKPTIAAISGVCIGGGFGLAQACDFRIADATATFAIPAARLGIVYNLVETRNLLATVGLNAAKEILFTGKRFDAMEAARIGFVNRLAEPQTDAMAAALAFAEPLRNAAPLTIAGAKVILNALVCGEVGPRRQEIRQAAERALDSADYREGVAAFQEQRQPVFTGS